MLAIIQARMSSKRLPGKVLMKIEGKHLLERVVERVSKSKHITKVVVATSKHHTDLPLRKLCFKKNIECYAGSLSNVANRFCEVLQKFNPRSFVRICADSPFIDPKIIDKCLVRFNKTNSDIVTNVLPRTFPRGQSVEIVRSSVFIKNLPKIKKKSQLEHILNFYYENKKKFKISNLKSNENYSKYNMSIDTASDIRTARNIYKKIFRSNNKNIGWKKIIRKYY